MPKHLRLSHEEFERLPKAGSRRVHGTLFSLTVFLLPSDIKGPKAACVVSKKVALKATVRNTIERRCREAIRRHCSALSSHSTYIFHAKKEAATALFSDISAQIAELLLRSDAR